MSQRILSALVYLITALALGNYFEVIGGLNPPNHPPSLISQILLYAAVAGAILFGVASIVALLSDTAASYCALVASLMTWPHFGPMLIHFPWRQFVTLLHPWPSDLWPSIILAVFLLPVTTVYVLARLISLRSLSAR